MSIANLTFLGTSEMDVSMMTRIKRRRCSKKTNINIQSLLEDCGAKAWTSLSRDSNITNGLVEQAKSIKAIGKEVVIDDRDERAGVKFAEADLIGIPQQIVLSKRGIDQGTIELVDRRTGNKEDLSIEDLIQRISS